LFFLVAGRVAICSWRRGAGLLFGLGADFIVLGTWAGREGPEGIVLKLGGCGARCFIWEACLCTCVDVCLGTYLAYLHREDGDTGLVEFCWLSCSSVIMVLVVDRPMNFVTFVVNFGNQVLFRSGLVPIRSSQVSVSRLRGGFTRCLPKPPKHYPQDARPHRRGARPHAGAWLTHRQMGNG